MNEISNNAPTTFDALGLGVQPAQAKPRTELGQDEFFKLMITQLSHQDPLKPLDGDELLSQVAQFSTVGGINNIEKSIAALVGSIESNQALQASTLVGREVLIPGEIVDLVTGQPVRGAARLDESTADLTVRITTPAGGLVRRLDLGPQAVGTIAFEWDGKDDAGAEASGGHYLVSATAGVGEQSQALGVPRAQGRQRQPESQSARRHPQLGKRRASRARDGRAGLLSSLSSI